MAASGTVNKTSEEIEREEAEESLNSILKSHGGTKPRNLREGLSHGVGSILSGAVGAAGVAVLAPTVGLTRGAQRGGVLGGVVGFTGGAVAGAVGAVGLAIGGAVSGVSQIVKGVGAVPGALQAKSKGQWWNEIEGRWVSTSLPDVAESIQNVPEDDSDILKNLEQKVEESIRPEASGEKDVKDMHYYNVLEVGANADASAIKRRYYVLAKKYHPDRVGRDDEESANKFKEIAEAYQVLSDPKLRAKYDKEGMEGLSPDKTEVADAAPNVDPKILFAFLFGSDKFRDYIGRLATATSAAVGDSNELSPADARLVQIRRVKRLAVTMAAKLQAWVEADTTQAKDECRARWMREAQELSTASYGIQLVHTLGQIYMLTAIQFLGSGDSGIGLPSISRWASARSARIKEKRARNRNSVDGVLSGIDMMTIQTQLEQKMQGAKTDAERGAIRMEMEKAASESLLKIMWTTCVVDITSTLHEVAQMVFFDQAVSVDTRKLRAQGLKELGQTFLDCPASSKDEDGEKMDAQTMYEEAAFAAMLETMKRKDEATFRASAKM